MDLRIAALLVLAVGCAPLANTSAGGGEPAADRAGGTTCNAHVVRTTTATGVDYRLFCTGNCADGEPCKERWLVGFDPAPPGEIVLTRTCGCDEEIRQYACCTDPSAGASYVRGTCRIALVYPAGADKDAQGRFSPTPTKPPTRILCLDDCTAEGRRCERPERVAEGEGIRVDLVRCSCQQLF